MESFDDQDCIDPQSLTKNMDEYLSSKGFLAIERIKDIIAEIMSSCQKKIKYEILESLIRGVVFYNKKLR